MVSYTHPLLSTPVVAILTQMLLELPWNTAIISNIFPPFPSVICSNLFFYTDPKIISQKCKFDHVRLLSKGSHYAQCGSTHWCHINLLHDRDSAVFLSGIAPSSPPFHFSDSALLHRSQELLCFFSGGWLFTGYSFCLDGPLFLLCPITSLLYFSWLISSIFP